MESLLSQNIYFWSTRPHQWLLYEFEIPEGAQWSLNTRQYKLHYSEVRRYILRPPHGKYPTQLVPCKHDICCSASTYCGGQNASTEDSYQSVNLVRSESPLSVCRNIASLAIQNDPNKYYGQTERLHGLISSYSGHTCPKVYILMLWLVFLHVLMRWQKRQLRAHVKYRRPHWTKSSIAA